MIMKKYHDRREYSILNLASSFFVFNYGYQKIYCTCNETTLAMFKYLIRRLIGRSRKVSKLQDLCLELSDHFQILQAHRKHCCLLACRIAKR